jgi:glutamate/tyrosine decarboxylase-like PLP-dependent enzyme
MTLGKSRPWKGHPLPDIKTTAAFLRTSKELQQTTTPLTPAPTAWFLGPRAENANHLADLVGRAVARHCAFRRLYNDHHDDPAFASEEQLASESHLKTCERTVSILEDTLDQLGRSIPLAAYRNQSHMYWDVTLPASAGYVAGMLFNQNNVAAEASPVTTAMEIEAAGQICTMLGYDMASDPPPWGHVTCDGSVANTEAMWAARNLRYHGVAAAAALEEDARLARARDVTVRSGDGRLTRLLDLTRWEQMNLPAAELLSLAARMAEISGLDAAIISDALGARVVQNTGLLDFHQRRLGTIRETPVIFAPATAHYSWEKAAAILGLGLGAVRLIPVDEECRMILPALRAELEDALRCHRPVLQVVAVTGTTHEGAVDPLADILAIRDEYEERGLSFSVHADAAWGGYFASMLRPARANAPEDPDQTIGFDPYPEEALSDHAQHHLGALGGADTITVDPHKAGFVPYPAGCLCYRDGRMTDLISVTSPVVYHDGTAQTVGVYGIEGSKPGAAAVATLMSHRVIPTDASGYGRLLARCIFASKRFYAATVTLPDAKTPYTITPLIRLPAERRGATQAEIRDELETIRTRLVPPQNPELMAALDAEPELRALFREFGPDLTVFAYAINFRTAAGLNHDHGLMNELNARLFDMLSLQSDEGKSPPDRDLFVTAGEVSPDVAGTDYVDALAKRAGVVPAPHAPLRFLISTIQNPWITATAGGNVIPRLMDALDKAMREAIAEIVARHDLDPFVPPKS